MSARIPQPTPQEIEEIVARAVRCADCDAEECFEFTPEGVDACSGLHYWNGKPVLKSVLASWRRELAENESNN